MDITADGDGAFLQIISMAEHFKESWVSIVYILLAEHLTRPVVLREPVQIPGQPSSRIMHSRLCSSRVSDVPYHKVFAHRSRPVAYNSSSFLSIHRVLVSTQALSLARVGEAQAICLCPHPFSNPCSLQFEDVNDKIDARSNVWKCDWLIESREVGKAQWCSNRVRWL